ncbi:MAG TPA: M14 family metallopeptidase [Candidatus Thermoplasmatota archaeon]|nr:M14 family metallopeptidase [Candidatus Thermoplasmatota archaeon]
MHWPSRRASLQIVLVVVLAGCVGVPEAPLAPSAAAVADLPAAPPALVSGFHRVADVERVRDAIVAAAGPVGGAFSIGESVQGRPILGVRLTAPGDASDRVRVLVDGGIHGNEVYGIEAAIYLAAFLAENYGRNATVTRVLEEADVRVVLLLNPDGREAGTRGNSRGVDMNRNFDVDFGNPSPLCRSQTLSPALPYYAGPRPLSEPETASLATLMEEFRPQIYLSHHTGRHGLIRPWSACDPPHPMPASDDALFEHIESWTRANTPYQNTGTAEETAQRLFPPGAASGSSSDWCYLTYHCVALTLEVTEHYGEQSDDPLQWSKEVLPINLHLLENARAYAQWRIPA